MKKIKLHGWLGKKFGREFTIDVHTPAEGVRALCAMIDGFQISLANDKIGFTIFVEDRPLSEESFLHPFSEREVFHIVPVISGSKSGIGQIFMGIAMIALAFVTMGTSLLGQGLLYEAVMTGLTSIGTSLILGGISQLLFAPPKAKAPAEAPANTPSSSFNGAVNTLQQGNCVPIAYGEIIVGSQVVSAGLFVEDFVV